MQNLIAIHHYTYYIIITFFNIRYQRKKEKREKRDACMQCRPSLNNRMSFKKQQQQQPVTPKHFHHFSINSFPFFIPSSPALFSDHHDPPGSCTIIHLHTATVYSPLPPYKSSPPHAFTRRILVSTKTHMSSPTPSFLLSSTPITTYHNIPKPSLLCLYKYIFHSPFSSPHST